MKKAYIDSNIIIRLIVKDSPKQLLTSHKIIETIEKGTLEGIVSILVVGKIVWILQNYYDMQRSLFIPLLIEFLSLENVKIPEIKKSLLITILQHMEEQNIDFTDLYLLYTAGKTPIMSFDKDFAKIKPLFNP